MGYRRPEWLRYPKCWFPRRRAMGFLSDARIRAAKPKDKAHKLFDTQGSTLRFRPRARGSGGSSTACTGGSGCSVWANIPTVSLSRALEKRDEARRLRSKRTPRPTLFRGHRGGVAGAATQTVRTGEVHPGHPLSKAHDPRRCGYELAGDTCTLVSVLGLRNRSNTIGSSSSVTTEVMSIFGSAWPLSITSATY
jgi:hypothetical protein